MVNAFELQQGRLRQIVVDSLEDLRGARPVWVDFDEASEEERAWARETYGFKLPDHDEEDEEVGDIEASARFFVAETGELHIRSDFFLLGDEGGENLRVAFVLKGDILFSVHAEDLPVFRLLRLRARSQPGYVEDAKDVLLELYAANVEYSADALEGIYQRLDAFGDKVLGTHLDDEIAAAVLSDIAREEDLNQNKIIKIFSVASVAMLPPTLIASLYGMNFRVMPELDWKFGYPFALCLMVLSMVAPFWYFRRKGWLK